MVEAYNSPGLFLNILYILIIYIYINIFLSNTIEQKNENNKNMLRNKNINSFLASYMKGSLYYDTWYYR